MGRRRASTITESGWSSRGPPETRRTYTSENVRDTIELNDKKRYEMRETVLAGSPMIYVRASQGHTMKSIKSDAVGKLLTLDPKAIAKGTDADGIEVVEAQPYAVHGTFAEALDGETGILKKGLHRTTATRSICRRASSASRSSSLGCDATVRSTSGSTSTGR